MIRAMANPAIVKRTDIEAKVAADHNLSKKDAKAIVGLVFDTIAASLAKKKKVAISGFGNFEAKKSKPRIAMNPQTKEKVKVPAKTRLKFRPAKVLKDQVIK